MPQNLVDAALEPTTQSAAPTTNLVDAALSAAPNTEPQTPAGSPTPQKPVNLVDAALAPPSIAPQQPVQSSSKTDDSAPWYTKAWGLANTPLIDDSAIEKWTGWKPNFSNDAVGGLGRGVLNLAEGLTSPLSVAFMIGTLGTGGLIESGASSILRTAGLGAEEIADVAKGSQIMSDTLKAGKSADEAWGAIAQAGLDPQKVNAGFETLAKSGLTKESILRNGLARNTGSAMLRQVGMTAQHAEKTASTISALIDGGFAANNVYGAAIATPRALDALKEGDYGTASQLITEAAGGAGFGILGAHAAFKEAGQTMSDAAAAAGLRVKPSETNLQLMREFDIGKRERVETSRAHKLWEEDIRDRYKNPSQDRLARIRSYIEHGDDEGEMARIYNALAESAGSDKRMPVDASMAGVERMLAQGRDFAEQRKQNPDKFVVGLNSDDEKQFYMPFEKDGKVIGGGSVTGRSDLGQGVAETNRTDINAEHQGKGYAKDLYAQLYAKAREQGFTRLVSDSLQGAESRRAWEGFVKRGLAKEFTDVYGNKRFEFGNLDDALTKPPLPENAENPRIRELIDQHLVSKDGLEKLLDSHDPTKLTDEDRQMAKEIRDKFSDTYGRASEANALGTGDGVQDYVTALWDKPNNPAANRLVSDANGGAFAVNTSMARKRIFEHTDEGQLLGYKLKTTDPIELAGYNAATFDRIIADRKTLERLRDTGVKEDGGRPMLALEGRGTVLENEGENPAVLVRPNQMSSIRVADKVIAGLKKTGTFDAMVKDGRLVKFGEGDHYAWSTADYQDIDHTAFRGWKVPTMDTDGNPVILDSRLRVHPRAAEYLKTQLEGPSDIATNPILKKAAKAGAEAKGLLLFGSPFHLFQEGLRAIMTGISPFGVDKWDLRTDPTLGKGVEHGLTLPEYKSRADFSEGLAGHSKLISKVPGLAQIQSGFSDFLFDRYIPSLKARAFKSLYARYGTAHPEWTDSKIAEEAAADTNSRFGGINWKREGRSAATQDIFRLAALAPDWLESEMRFMGRVFGSGGDVARKDVARMALYMWGTARVLNYLVSGQAHNEAPLGVVFKGDDGREKVYSMRSIPSDLLHAVQDPTGFLKGRRSPLINFGIEAATGRDTLGRKLPTHSIIVDALSNVAPIPVQSISKSLRGESPDVSNPDQVWKGLGGAVNVYRTEAQKLAGVIAADKSESGPIDPSKLRRHLATLKFTDDVRSGAMPVDALHKLVETGHLSVTEGKEILKTAEETKGMPPDDARLYIRASRLGLPDFLKIWDAGTAGEKARLAPLLLKKKQAYLKKVNKDMAPQERLADPTYQWVRKSFPQEPPW